MLKANQEQRKIIGSAAVRFFRFRLKSSRHEIKKLVGKQRKILQQIVDDLIREKTLGKLNTKEEELNYVKSNLEQGKYGKEE